MAELAERMPPGAFVEVGVYRGGSAWRLYEISQRQNRELFLYDTFEGIPHHHPVDSHKRGDFADTEHSAVMERFPHAWVVKGVFPLSALPMPGVAFAHLDCDQYQSVLESALYLQALMVPGAAMWFDDSPCLAGAQRAVAEVFGDRAELSGHGKHFVLF